MATKERAGTLMLLSRLSKQAMRATPESEMGMSARHFMALHTVEGGELHQQQLAEMMCIDANNTVILLNEMETAGWVVRERDPADRRRHVVRVTEAGRAAYEHALSARDGFEDAVLGPLSPEERQQLHDLLAKSLGRDPET